MPDSILRDPIDVAATLRSLKVNEKTSLLAGQDNHTTVPIERLGIPSITLSDGQHGVRGARYFNAPRGMMLPAASGMGATFDKGLMLTVGRAIGREAKEKNAHVLLAPTVCLQRSPLIGRGFEAFGEDPILSGLLASSYINGIQENGVAASIKHFAAHDQSKWALEDAIRVSERTLRELHLLPFQIAIKDSNPWKVREATVDLRVRNILNLINKVRPALNYQKGSVEEGDTLDKRQLCRKVAADSIVLLKNNKSVLPLDVTANQTCGLIGLAARYPTACGGGSAELRPYYVNTPYDSIVEAVGKANVKEAVGAYGHIFAPLLQQDITVPGTQEPGYLLEWYLKEPTAGTDSPLYTEVGTQGLMMFAHSLPKCVEGGSYWLRITTTYKATKTATMQFGLAVLGRGRMFIDGKEVIDLFTSHPPKTAQSPMFNQCSMEVVADFDVTVGSEYQMMVTLVNGGIEAKAGAAAAGGARVSCCEKINAGKGLQDAVELAKSVDVPIIYVGELRGFSGTGDEVTYIGATVEANNIDTFATHLETGKTRRLSNHPEYVDPMTFSYDNKWMVLMDTRGSDRQMWMAGMRGIPPLIDVLTIAAASTTRNNGARRFFQPILLDGYGDRDPYYGQQINAKGNGSNGSVNDPNLNGRADPAFSKDGTKIVFWQTLVVAPACGGVNPLPCPQSTAQGGREYRVVLAKLTSREPTTPPPAVKVPDIIPWAVQFQPGTEIPPKSYLSPGEYTLAGKKSGSANVSLLPDEAGQIDTVAVNYLDYSDDGRHIINGYENVTRSILQGNPWNNHLDWYSDLDQTGATQATKKTSDDGFHLTINVMGGSGFNATGELTTTIKGKVYRQPANFT
ncbi:unnamed protein product [Clonostachys rhizophaga]|uniref:beta-glucosidase n=1 Tax=Clonostachys rhizophaga TaxID=160324 RepID=A0A9N9V9B2_9HYPO|nr:unnamed protein product [Clonostachys rhizophaga]